MTNFKIFAFEQLKIVNKIKKLEEISKRSHLPMIPSDKLKNSDLSKNQIELKEILRQLKKSKNSMNLEPEIVIKSA